MKAILQKAAIAVGLILIILCFGNQEFKVFAEGEENAFKLKPKYLINNSNFDMMSATVTDSPTAFRTTGNFRTSKDFNLLYWEVEDLHSHPDFKYPTDGDFTDVILEYTYEIKGDLVPMDAVPSPTLTVVTNDNQAYYIRLWNYVTNRPLENWEEQVGDSLGIPYTYPSNRKPGLANGIQGTVRIDFNELYSGWVAFTQQEDDQGNAVWVPNPDWVKVPTNNIKRLEWALVPQEYDYNEAETVYFTESKPFEISFTNWEVYGDAFLMQEKPLQPLGKVHISDGYDDSYNLTPERIVGDYFRLGFGNKVDFYIGASHFYDKVGKDDGTLELIKEKPFNQAFEEWYKSYLSYLSSRNVEVVASISMENVDAPSSWWQRTWDGKAAETLYSPAPKLLSFTNSEVQSYYKQFVLSLADLHAEYNMNPIVQLGEPWWWYMDSLSGSPPTFYDASTKYRYEQQFGKPMHTFKSAYDSTAGHEDMLNWLSDQNGNFSLMLRDTLKSKYPEGQFTVLLFIPTVVDPEWAPEMMGIVNFPIEQWKSPNLDFFMIEDYDYLIENYMEKHRQALTLAQRKLGYSADKVHYLAGADSTNNTAIWKNIDQAINDGINMKFGGVYLWAYPQVKSRGWTQPVIIESTVAPGLQKGNSINIQLSSQGADSILYTVDGREPSLSTAKTYTEDIVLTKDTKLKASAVINGILSDPVTFDYIFDRQEYQYDVFNRLQSVTLFQDEQKYRISYTYDKNGNMTKKLVNKVFNIWTDQNIIPVMSSNQAPDGSIASASSSFGDNYLPYKAFDHLDNEQAWITNGVVDGWIAFKFSSPRNVISYRIYPRNEPTAIQASPRSWSFEGFNGQDWIVLSEEKEITEWKVREAQTFNVEQDGTYSEYRINVKENNGYWYTSIGEIEMIEGEGGQSTPVKQNLIPPMTANESLHGTASADSEFGSGYAAYKAFDHQNSEQSWITNGKADGWLAFQFPLAHIVRSYKIMPRYDESTLSSAPKSWTFEGFNGNEWRVLSTESNVTEWKVSEFKTFTVQSPGSFAKYRINITENNGHSWTSIGELEMTQ